MVFGIADRNKMEKEKGGEDMHIPSCTVVTSNILNKSDGGINRRRLASNPWFRR